ncbi:MULTISPECIES: radical SAM protein [unclassified Pseudomonas]|uniref:radical SAM protein n=1 Tax=unclassified Pseudomonas TaxID=196821 RepID=UPI000BCFF56E|nr:MULTISPECIES: radical SAM protein [unclassified Pseudomonas]PVZ15414.1 oxygen-independent coproporphyrinogen-3 oxidase [Pseudomonas sp. URIL14HWK12:I12]PVZ24788.1 oxygen-independent coproporphyrinogen-3 oxidase [Pseudomonas sp. URIL14HWK12:I10]PVZ34634.1 oxygen-independent coproporphyrinogen-3 oxidase [Pseudomonas sp. URIL14HWK12:I11]SNZ08827.1 oxygen-independent coproporphyrinogen-3 oxidase [Pseudomonas sp. URIL14HWK12:I9]
MNAQALGSLNDLDPNYPVPRVHEFLADPTNSAMLDYVYNDPFGCHVFPGDIEGYPLGQFFQDMDQEIGQARQIHLWAYIPTCRYRCHFCQYPTVILNPKAASSQQVFTDVVDYNIKEASLWLQKVPALATAQVGEFNIFGGTPSLLPEAELRRLMGFYRSHFDFSAATLRFEGEPGTLNKPYLSLLKELGFTKISFGAQSFDDRIISACGRMHSAQECVDTIEYARAIGLEWVSVDLIYGMLGQAVDDVKYDMEKTLELDLSHVVIAKLHMEEFMKTRTGVSGERQSHWQRKGLINIGDMTFPGLGKQYQMRELVEQYLAPRYNEQPTMYFHRQHQPPEKWKGLITNLDTQYPEVAIGLGGSSKCTRAEAINITGYNAYKQALDEGRLPIDQSRGVSPLHREVNAFKMALSTLIPVDDQVFRQRFDGRSYHDNPIISQALQGLQAKTLVRVDGEQVQLTPNGVTLVEAVINTQFAAAQA